MPFLFCLLCLFTFMLCYLFLYDDMMMPFRGFHYFIIFHYLYYVFTRDAHATALYIIMIFDDAFCAPHAYSICWRHHGGAARRRPCRRAAHARCAMIEMIAHDIDRDHRYQTCVCLLFLLLFPPPLLLFAFHIGEALVI